MKKFILMNSPIFWDSNAEKEQYLSPLGLGYIATYLEKSKIDVELVDCVKLNWSVKEIIKYINQTSPSFLGMNIFTQNYDIVKYIIEHINVCCECFIGGQAVKNLFQDILTWNTSNQLNIVIGEGELILPALACGNCFQQPEIAVQNKFVYRVNAVSEYFPKDISNIALNRRFLGDETIINHYGQREASIITSRGCTYNCAFCGGARSLNKDIPIRIRTSHSIIAEIEDILNIYPDVRSIRILDDLFLRNGKSVDVANEIFSKFPQLRWRGMVHVLSLIHDLEKTDILPQSGCEELFLGIESGSEDIRKRINKLGKTEDILKVASAILRNHIDLKGYFIYGFPDETEEDFKQTYELALKISEIAQKTGGNFRTSVFQFRPYHGTKLYNEIIKTRGIIHGCEINNSINGLKGRNQFNFSFGNYSAVSDEILNQYIIKTQKLGVTEL